MKFHDFSLLPDWVLFEFSHEDFVLLAILSKTLLCFLCALDPVSDDHSGDATIDLILLALRGILISADLILVVHELSRHFEGGRMLVEGRLGFFLEQGVDALVQVFARHVVIDDAKQAVLEHGALVPIDHAVADL